MTTRTLTVSRLALAAAAGVVGLFANDSLLSTQQFSLITQADARVGRPLTPVSVAGVARRTERRAIRRGAVVGAAAVGTAAYYGTDGYYGTGGFYGTGGYYTGGYYYGAASPPAAPVPDVALGAGYGPGPVAGSVIVNPSTGRWCTFQNGWQWCWTP